MTSVLVLFAHPALEKSRVNRRLVEAARARPDVTVRDLYEIYPDGLICAKEEQRHLLSHDAIVLQHPFYWYSCPPLLKEWLDVVLEHGFAYGRKATALRGKRLLQAITVGGGPDSYGRNGLNVYTIDEFLRPFEATAALCGMTYLSPFVVHGTHKLTSDDIASAAESYAARLAALGKE